MVNNKLELLDAIRSESIPIDAQAIWDGRVPTRIAWICQPPELLFEAFLTAPSMFPCSGELLILWQTNGESITGYLREKKIYIVHYMEDGPSRYRELGTTYQQMLSGIFGNLLISKTDDQALEEVRLFFGFKYLGELKEFVMHEVDWEENTASCIQALEAAER